MSGNEQVKVEMQVFLAALVSYPDRFAVNPRVSFEQHRVSLMAPGELTVFAARRANDDSKAP